MFAALVWVYWGRVLRKQMWSFSRGFESSKIGVLVWVSDAKHAEMKYYGYLPILNDFFFT